MVLEWPVNESQPAADIGKSWPAGLDAGLNRGSLVYELSIIVVVRMQRV